MIDVSTLQSLELVQNIRNVKSKGCLFGLMNETLTPMGSRLLRSCILQPATQLEVLHPRFDAVDELATKEDMFFQVRQGKFTSKDFQGNTLLTQIIALKPILDIERLLSSARAHVQWLNLH